MSFVHVFSLSATILASLGGGGAIVLGLSRWLGKIWASQMAEAYKADLARGLKEFEAELSRAGENRRRKLEGLMRHYERQIEEFYGPLFNAVQQIYVANDIQSEVLKQAPSESAAQIRDYFNGTYFDPLHDEVRKIFHSKLYLVEGHDVPESFLEYLRHASQDRDQRLLWSKLKVDTSFMKGTPWPDGFDDDIRTGFKNAMKSYDDCLSGLKA